MNTISYNQLVKTKKLSPHQLKNLSFKNEKTHFLGNLLDRNLTSKDKGTEVGSDNYISESAYYFMRSKSLQDHSLLPYLESDSFIPIKKGVFENHKLKKGDVIISKDSNVGEAVILDKDYPNHMLSGALYKLPISKNKYYILAFLKHRIFRRQLDVMVPKAATIRHAGKKFLKCKIPIPNQNNGKAAINLVEQITQAIVNKEIEIKKKNSEIFKLIETELLKNQKGNSFNYKYPSYKETKLQTRLDVGLYSKVFKKNNFLVTNYKFGYINLIDRGYFWSRGTSLEIKGLGTRVDRETYKEGYCELIIPTDISEYGTVTKSSFIGTPKKLKIIHEGDIIFGGEGFRKGRSFVVCENVNNIATNYHGIRIYRKNTDLIDSIFIRCFLAYWRSKGMIDFIGVGGSGGHCAPQYFHLIETPLFPVGNKMKVAKLYHNKINYPKDLTRDNFLIKDRVWNKDSGIYEIDKTIKKLTIFLNDVLNKIAENRKVNPDYSFISGLFQ